MDYHFYKTHEISEELFDSFVMNFNHVYTKSITKDEFKHNYLNTVKGYSYHVFMVKNDEVVGACAVIPFEYKFFDKRVILGLSVGLYIHEDYRSDLLALSKITKLFRKELVKDNVASIIAVNNYNAYFYYKRMCKWQDIGELNYYVLPVRVGSILKKWTFINRLTSLSANLYMGVVRQLASVFNFKERTVPISLNREDYNTVYEKWKYYHGYTRISKPNLNYSYKIYEEDTIQTAYIIDFSNKKGIKDNYSLSTAVADIISKEKVDIIMYIGTLNLKNFALFKVPKSKEPRKLYFTCDILMQDVIKKNELCQLSNWDFNLFSLDVR